MTRFARAKGSKSSNERLPDEATPWDVMKQQLQDSQAAKQAGKEKTKSARQLLAEKDEPFYYDATGNVGHEWAEFDNVPSEGKAKKVKDSKLNKTKANKREKSKLKEAAKSIASDNDLNIQTIVQDSSAAVRTNKKSKGNDAEEISEAKSNKLKKKNENHNADGGDAVGESDRKKNKKNKGNFEKSDETTAPTVTDPKSNDSEQNSNVEPVKLKKKKSRKSKLNTNQENRSSNDPENSMNDTESEPSKKRKNETNNDEGDKKEENVEKSMERLSKRQKRNRKKKNKNMSNEANNEVENRSIAKDSSEKTSLNSGGFDLQGNEWSNQVKFGKHNKQKLGNDDASANDKNEISKSKKKGEVDRNEQKLQNKNGPEDENNLSGNKSNSTDNKNHNENSNQRKAAKLRDNKEHKRRKPDTGVIKMIMNGIEVEVVKYDGFPVKKEDAERLKELKQNMIIKGIPRSEINAAMKLERRKAEKALTRERKRVCFHCRKSGHNLSDCPELGRDEAGSGICFKCGSTEHTHFECKVTKGQEFRFASCFICREQGHIARQCPDNPKGLYPQGGACKLCGDVTHLKKDCPDLIKEKEETNITVDKISDNRLESLDEDVGKRTEIGGEKPKNKIVKF